MPREVINTTCTMDCPDTCALEVTVNNNKITKIAGAKSGHPDTDGFICTKVSRFAKRVYHKERLLYPMRRTGRKGSNSFERISWEVAIETIVERFADIKAEWGGEAILPYHYGGSNGFLGDEFLDHYYFAKLGASRCQKTLCAVPTTLVTTEMYGKMPGVAFEDYPHSKFILIWGANPKASNIHLTPYLKEARKNGAFIVVVDPKRNFSTKEVDLHLPVYPGADLPLALGIINYWQQNNLLDQNFLDTHCVDAEKLLSHAADWPLEKAAESSGVPSKDIVLLAEKYAAAQPAVLRCGWGVERNANGGDAIAAIMAMPALLGKFGVQGGGYTMSNSGASSLDKEKIFGKTKWNTRAINQSQLGTYLNNPEGTPVKALFVYNCNPLATVPDQNAVLKGFAREDLFTVVFEQVMTDSAMYADILLPAVTFLEQQEIRRAYGSYAAGGVQPVIPALGEAKPNEAVFAMLGRASGWDDAPFHWDTSTYMKKVSDALMLNKTAADYATLNAGKVQSYDFDGRPPVQFETVFPKTANQKVYLVPKVLGDAPYVYHPIRDSRYPLAMISPANNKMVSSTLGEFNYPELFLDMHPADAAARGLSNKDIVKVYNELGEVVCRLKMTRGVREGVVSMPKGAWRKSSRNSQTSTALCPATINKVGGAACFNDARVEVAKFSENGKY